LVRWKLRPRIRVTPPGAREGFCHWAVPHSRTNGGRRVHREPPPLCLFPACLPSSVVAVHCGRFVFPPLALTPSSRSSSEQTQLGQQRNLQEFPRSFLKTRPLPNARPPPFPLNRQSSSPAAGTWLCSRIRNPNCSCNRSSPDFSLHPSNRPPPQLKPTIAATGLLMAS